MRKQKATLYYLLFLGIPDIQELTRCTFNCVNSDYAAYLGIYGHAHQQGRFMPEK